MEENSEFPNEEKKVQEENSTREEPKKAFKKEEHEVKRIYVNRTKVLIFALFLVIFVMTLSSFKAFEREKPTIIADDEVYWNLKKDIGITIKDNHALKLYNIYAILNKKRYLVESKYIDKKQEEHIAIRSSFTMPVKNKDMVRFEVEVYDDSIWNFFRGNRTVKDIIVHIDTTKPNIFSIANSYSIIRGGSAVVIFKAQDNNLKDLRLVSGKRNFKFSKFYKDGYYIAMLSWNIRDKNFVPKIYAIDKAGNISFRYLKIIKIDRKYRKSKIKITDKFLGKKVMDIINKTDPQANLKTAVDKIKYINLRVRNSAENEIRYFTSTIRMPDLKHYDMFEFHPLNNGMIVGEYGMSRKYIYKGQELLDVYHLGMDFASVKNDNIYLSNPGLVVFNGYLGVYGNTLIIDHGLNIYSVYGHTSKYLVNVGDFLPRGTIIAQTGATGLAFGDHLHLGIVVQQNMVNPHEWMSKDRIFKNITGVIKEAKSIMEIKD